MGGMAEAGAPPMTDSERRVELHATVAARAERESPIPIALALVDLTLSFFGPDAKREGIVQTLMHRGCLRSEAERVADAWERLTGSRA